MNMRPNQSQIDSTTLPSSSATLSSQTSAFALRGNSQVVNGLGLAIKFVGYSATEAVRGLGKRAKSPDRAAGGPEEFTFRLRLKLDNPCCRSKIPDNSLSHGVRASLYER